jgi:hypothetical protein
MEVLIRRAIANSSSGVFTGGGSHCSRKSVSLAAVCPLPRLTLAMVAAMSAAAASSRRPPSGPAICS